MHFEKTWACTRRILSFARCEEKLRKEILYLKDKIDWSIFYEQLVKIQDMYNKIRSAEDILKHIMKKMVWKR